MTTWIGADPPPAAEIGPAGWIRVALRGAAVVTVTFGGLAILLLVRLLEAPLFAPRRPLTPWITQAVCRIDLLLIGLRLEVRGQPMHQNGAAVANHASWLDILVLNACQRVCFVSKAEIARWPAIGWLARATGTVFIARDPRAAGVQQRLLQERLRAGHHLLVFPEGTSTDGRRVLPFKTTLFGAFMAEGIRHAMAVQPISVTYLAPDGEDARFYAWWGHMDFAPHAARVLACPRRGTARVVFHAPLQADAYPSRKALAAACEQAVRSGFGVASG
ncbi:MAG: 1-acyl-sn-glycerol-3-phosphate acyltransferase [Rhodobacteraceae bacterium]|nr:1-acyl-sn-glycerol-3-phosphate acyltransferase [Paracoccaceae bacterium]